MATPDTILASYWSSARKPIDFGFAGLKTSCFNLCFVVANERSLTFFSRNAVKTSPNFSLLGLVMFSNVCSASPFMRDWKWFVLSSSVG